MTARYINLHLTYFYLLRSTCTNLLESLNDWTFSIHYNNCVTVIVHIDFNKAFDSVTHSKLLDNWPHMASVIACYVGLIFLCNRTHHTRVEMSLSTAAELMSGIVQGSGIGPLLCLIFINDLIEHLTR